MREVFKKYLRLASCGIYFLMEVFLFCDWNKQFHH